MRRQNKWPMKVPPLGMKYASIDLTEKSLTLGFEFQIAKCEFQTVEVEFHLLLQSNGPINQE